MLTFKNAPNTLLGPCEHALWDGTVFVSKHHQHMPDGLDAWKAQIKALTDDTITADAVCRMVDANRKLGRTRMWTDKDAHRKTLAQWSDALKLLEDSLKGTP